MHLEGPWLSTTGKKKGKKKFASAEHARKAREQEESWNALQKKWCIQKSPKKVRSESLSSSYSLSIPAGRNTTSHIKSVDTGGGIAVKKESPKYTGTLIKGIATMHKSNAVPVLNQEDAEAISKMRR
jgi:beta-lactamase superfamily II metal-dependent hydrolase